MYLEESIHSSNTDAIYSEQRTMSLKTHLKKTVREQEKNLSSSSATAKRQHIRFHFFLRKKVFVYQIKILPLICVYIYIYIIYIYIYIYTGCNRRNGPNFGRVFLMLNYTEKTQNTYVQS